MNNLVVKPQNLPVAKQPSAFILAATSGLGGDGRPFPEVGIKGSRWRLKPQGDGEEQVLSSFNIQFGLVNVNPAKSKTFYLNKYDPDGEPAAPDCFSDDGVRPHPDAQLKQADGCAMCPHNVWGSAVNETTGKKRKRCADSKRLAIMLVGSPAEIYAWRLSPTNMISFADTLKRDVMMQGVDLDRVILDARFDDKSDYPHVLFKVARAMTPEEEQAIAVLRKSEGAMAAIGMGAPVVRAVVAQVATPPAPAPAVSAPKRPKSPATVTDLDEYLDGDAAAY